MNQLATIPMADARLPVVYEAAKTALANCASIDECQDWADKAEALASYARQADDDSLRKQADRIQARAIRRCGELLKQFDGRGSPNKTEGTHGISQRQAAERAGLSEHQQLQSVRVANVPADQFEREVESEAPPTVTALAQAGTKKREPIIDLKGRDPTDFNKAMHFKGLLQEYSRDLSKWNLPDILPRLIDADRDAIRKLITEIDSIHDAIITRI